MKKHIILLGSLLLTIAGNICPPLYAQTKTPSAQIDEWIAAAAERLKTNPSEAVYYANIAIAEAQKTDDRSRLAAAQATLGEAYMNQGDFDLGFEAVMNALEACPPGDRLLQASVYVKLSSAYTKLHDFDQAFRYVDKASEIYRQAGDQRNLAGCYNIRGLIYIQLPDNVRAEENFRQALAINRQLGLAKQIAVNLNNLSLYETPRPEEKIALLHEAIAINDSLGAVWSLGENYNNLATHYFYAGDYERALASLRHALMYIHQIQAKELLCDNYRYASWVYAARKEYAKAYENLLYLYHTEQELQSKDAMRRIELNQVQKRLQAKEQEMLVQRQSFQIRNLRLRNWIAVLVTIAVLLLSVYIIIHSRQQKKIQTLEASKLFDRQEKELIALQLQQAEQESKVVQQELDYNREELTNFAFFVRSRNELLSRIQSMIKEGYKLSGSEMDAHLRNINAYISQFNAKNTETEVLIDKVNARFIGHLSALHPDLSKNEQRLASLLRIGLSTKEIASIIDSNPKTVNMARYRLRKRLGLDTDESLTEYMKSI